MMEFIGLLLCLATGFIMCRKLYFIIKGQVVNGEVVGLEEGVRGLYHMRGYNFRIRIEHENQIYIATSFEVVTTVSGYPAKEARGYYKVYFIPEKPRFVSIKGRNSIIWIAFFGFVLGMMMLVQSLI